MVRSLVEPSRDAGVVAEGGFLVYLSCCVSKEVAELCGVCLGAGGLLLLTS